MKARVMAELLTQYIDRINAGRDDTEAYLSLFQSHQNELSPLFKVVKVLRAILVKSEPSAAFMDTLSIGLRMAAQQAIDERRHEERAWIPQPSRRSIVLGAAALGSIAWLAALLVFTRSRPENSIKSVA